MNEEVVKNTKFNKLNTKVNKSENEIPDVATLILTNQYNAYKQNLEKKNDDVDNKILDISNLVTTTVLNIKIGEVENKIPDFCGLVK